MGDVVVDGVALWVTFTVNLASNVVEAYWELWESHLTNGTCLQQYHCSRRAEQYCTQSIRVSARLWIGEVESRCHCGSRSQSFHCVVSDVLGAKVSGEVPLPEHGV